MKIHTGLLCSVAMLVALGLATVSAASAMTTPSSFVDGDAVLASIDQAISACGSSGAADCKTTCETSRRLAGSYLGQSKVNGQGDMLLWGCQPQNTHNCFVVEIMPHQVEYRAIDEAVKTAWQPAYEAALKAAQP